MEHTRVAKEGGRKRRGGQEGRQKKVGERSGGAIKRGVQQTPPPDDQAVWTTRGSTDGVFDSGGVGAQSRGHRRGARRGGHTRGSHSPPPHKRGGGWGGTVGVHTRPPGRGGARMGGHTRGAHSGFTLAPPPPHPPGGAGGGTLGAHTRGSNSGFLVGVGGWVGGGGRGGGRGSKAGGGGKVVLVFVFRRALGVRLVTNMAFACRRRRLLLWSSQMGVRLFGGCWAGGVHIVVCSRVPGWDNFRFHWGWWAAWVVGFSAHDLPRRGPVFWVCSGSRVPPDCVLRAGVVHRGTGLDLSTTVLPLGVPLALRCDCVEVCVVAAVCLRFVLGLRIAGEAGCHACGLRFGLWPFWRACGACVVLVRA